MPKRPIDRDWDEEANSRWADRYARYFESAPGGQDRIEKHMVQELSRHLGEKNDRGRQDKTGVIVVADQKKADEMNKAVREEMRAKGVLSSEERTVERLQRLDWSNAQKSRQDNYAGKGNILRARFLEDVGDFKKGDVYPITGPAPKADGLGWDVLVDKGQAQIGELPIKNPDSFEICSRQEIALTKGEQVRVTKDTEHLRYTRGIHPDKDKDTFAFKENEQYRIDNCGERDLKLGAKEISNSNPHYTYGYAITPEQLPNYRLDKVMVADDRAKEHPRLQAYAEKYPKTVEFYQDKELEPSKGRDFSHLDAPARFQHLLREPSESERHAGRKRERQHEHERDEPEMEI